MANFQSPFLSMIVTLVSLSALAEIDAGTMVGSLAGTFGEVVALGSQVTGFNLNAVHDLQKIPDEGLCARPMIQEAICVR